RHLAAQPRPTHHLAAVRRPGRQRSAGSAERGRTDRRRRARQRPAGVVPAVRRRRPRLPQEGELGLLQCSQHAVLAAQPARQLTAPVGAATAASPSRKPPRYSGSYMSAAVIRRAAIRPPPPATPTEPATGPVARTRSAPSGTPLSS